MWHYQAVSTRCVAVVVVEVEGAITARRRHHAGEPVDAADIALVCKHTCDKLV